MTPTFILTGNNSGVQRALNLSCALCQEDSLLEEGCSILNLERPRFRSREGYTLYPSAEGPLGSGVSSSGVRVGSLGELRLLGIGQVFYLCCCCCCCLFIYLFMRKDLFYFFFLCVSVWLHLCLCVCTVLMQNLWRSEEVIGCPGTGVADACELLYRC